MATVPPSLDATVLSRATLDAMNELDVLYFVKDRERRFVVCTDALVHHLGFRHARQIIGLRDEDLSPAHLVEHYRQYDLQILEHGQRVVGLVELVRNVDGSYDWFTTTKWPLRASTADCRNRREGDDDPETNPIVGLAGVIKSLKPRHARKEEFLPLTPALELIADQYHRKLTIDELAESVAMSPSYFNRQFKRHFDTTPYRYLQSVRLMAVSDLLCTTELSLAAIAHQTGFYDQSHLSNEFSRRQGLSPLAYRRRYRRPVAPRPAGAPQATLRLNLLA